MYEDMKLIAASEGVNIYCQKEDKFSFFNSPYPAHGSYSGIDVYPKRSFGDVASSPIKGEVEKIRRVKCPKGKMFESSSYDYVILVRGTENPQRLVKILHVDPAVKVGDRIEPKDKLGTLIRSGFFDFWTDPHVHMEVRKPADPIRARGGLMLKRLMKLNRPRGLSELAGTVIESKREYAMIALKEEFKQGIPVVLNGQVGLLDGGIPHYKWFGVHTNYCPTVGTRVKLCGREIGTVKSTQYNMCVAKRSNPVFKVRGKTVRLSFYIYPISVALLKIIPQKPGGLSLKKFEDVSISAIRS